MTKTIDDRLISSSQCLATVGLSAKTVKRLITVGKFPKPVSLPNIRRRLWSYAQVQEWIAQRRRF